MKPKLDKGSNIYEFERLLKTVKAKEIELAWRLYCIRETNAWEGRYSSFSEMLDANHIRRDTASRMCTVIEQYVVKHSIALSQLEKISYRQLYDVRNLLDTEPLQKVLALAKENTPSELKDTIAELKHGKHHEHEPKDDRRYAWCECGKLMAL